jgi:hypothetical protein
LTGAALIAVSTRIMHKTMTCFLMTFSLNPLLSRQNKKALAIFLAKAFDAWKDFFGFF